MSFKVRIPDDYSQFEFLLETELEQIRRYIIGLDYSIKKDQIETKEWINKEIWPDKSEPMPTMIIEITQQTDVFTPNLFYKSSLTVLYSFFELSLREIVKSEREKRKISLNINDLKGDGITLYKDYLVKVIGIDLSSIDKFWQEIDKYKKVRNYIIHNESENSDIKKVKLIKEICKKNNYLVFSEETNEVNIVSSDYLIDFAASIENYFKGLLMILRPKLSAQQAVPFTGADDTDTEKYY